MKAESQQVELRPADSGELASWWRDHSDLNYLIGGVVHLLHQNNAAAAAEAVEELVQEVTIHFAAEEDTYFPLVERVAPQYTKGIRAARIAHEDLRERLNRVRENLAVGEIEEADQNFHMFLEVLSGHEESEAEIMTSINAVLGV